jgi:hypothetical protein
MSLFAYSKIKNLPSEEVINFKRISYSDVNFISVLSKIYYLIASLKEFSSFGPSSLSTFVITKPIDLSKFFIFFNEFAKFFVYFKKSTPL